MKTVHGIDYSEPEVFILHDTGIAHTEIAGRTAYNSFDNSEHVVIKALQHNSHVKELTNGLRKNDIDSSNLLSSLAWVHHHHSVLEHSSITYLIKGIGRGVLQELVRHRIASYTVKSSRYTMSSIINAYVASSKAKYPENWFIKKMHELNILITSDKLYNYLEYKNIFEKLSFQEMKIDTEDFINLSVAKSSLKFIDTINNSDELFKLLEEGKAKRNVGDPFKHIVTDNWKTDLVMTINLRSLKNFFELRDSGAAWFQIQWLAQAMKEVTPIKYLKLIDKQYKDKT